MYVYVVLSVAITHSSPRTPLCRTLPMRVSNVYQGKTEQEETDEEETEAGTDLHPKPVTGSDFLKTHLGAPNPNITSSFQHTVLFSKVPPTNTLLGSPAKPP